MTPSPPDDAVAPQPDPAPPPRAWPWVTALTLAGILLAIVPHLVNLARTGDAEFIADGDAMLYLAWSRDILRHGSWNLVDAVHRPSGPMMHPWILFGPPALVAHALGLGPGGLGVIWRVLAGAGMAWGFYAAARPFVATPRGAAGLAAFLLFDAGVLFGQVGQRQIEIALSMARGSTDYVGGVPRIMAHLRVPPPALAIPFLLAYYAMAHRARRLGTTRSALAAGVALGLLFHAYFYFATAAVAGAVLAWALDPAGRRTYGRMLVAGLVVAAPAVVAGAWIKSGTPPDWLLRTGKFVPVGRLDRGRLILPKVLILEWAVAGWFVLRRRRDLLLLWCSTAAGLALANQQVVTGMELENFHWTYAYGLAFSLLLPLLILPGLSRWKGWRWAVPGLIVVQVMLGVALRAFESTQSAETVADRARLVAWRGEGLDLPPGAVLAGPEPLLLLIAAVEDVDPLSGRLVEFSSAATDVERDRRVALNRLLSPVADESTSSAPSSPTIAEAIEADPGAWIARFGVTHALVPSGKAPPGAIEGWARREARGRTLDLWRVGPMPPPSPKQDL